jgi:hypothetical protein
LRCSLRSSSTAAARCRTRALKWLSLTALSCTANLYFFAAKALRAPW